MPTPMEEHLERVMDGIKAPSERDLRAAYEGQEGDRDEAIKASEEESAEESVEGSGAEAETEEGTQEDAGAEDEGDGAGEEAQEASEEDLQTALETAQSDLDVSRKEAEGRLKELIATRQGHKELKDEISGLKDSLKPVEPEEEPPNKEEDPLAYVAWQNEKIVAPMAERVEQLTVQVETMVQQRALGEAGAAVNAHIAQGLGEDKAKEAEFLQARDYLAGKYRDHFMSEEGLSEAEAVQKVGLFAINVGVEAIRTKQDFVAQVIETARGAGFKLKPGPKAGKNSTAAKKVRKGQKEARSTPNQTIGTKGRKITSAMMDDQEGELTHEEKLSIMGDDLHRRKLMTEGVTYLNE